MNERNKPIVQDPETRRHNFDEVSLGFDRQRMIDEANRCLGCKNAACVTGCPVEVNIPLFIAALKNDDPDKALEIINETNSLPAVCGRVCPQEKQCESKCVRGDKRAAGGNRTAGKIRRYIRKEHFFGEAGQRKESLCDRIGARFFDMCRRTQESRM